MKNGIILRATRDGIKTRLRLSFAGWEDGDSVLFYYDLEHPKFDDRIAVAQHYGDPKTFIGGWLEEGLDSIQTGVGNYRLERPALEKLWKHGIKIGVIEDDGRLWSPVKPQALTRPSALAERACA